MLEIKRLSIALGLMALAILGGGVVPVFAQGGKLTGKVVDSETREGVSFAAVRVLSGGAQKGVAIADINGDYQLDLLVGALGGPNACFLNLGGGRFTNSTAAAGLVENKNPF